MADDLQTPQSEKPHEGLLRLHPKWRGLVRFCLTVIATLIFGIALEKVTEVTAKDTVAVRAQFAKVQTNAMQAIAALKPSTALALFGDSMDSSPQSTAAAYHKAEEHRVGHAIAQGSLVSDDPSRYHSITELETGVRLGHWGATKDNTTIRPTALVAALLDVVWHLLTGGEIIARIVVLGQIALGGTLTALLMVWAAKRDIIDFGFWRLPFLSLGAVLFASGLAYATGFVITTSQSLLGGLGHLAGVSVGLGAVGSCCSAFVRKSLELTLDKHLESVIEKV